MLGLRQLESRNRRPLLHAQLAVKGTLLNLNLQLGPRHFSTSWNGYSSSPPWTRRSSTNRRPSPASLGHPTCSGLPYLCPSRNERHTTASCATHRPSPLRGCVSLISWFYLLLFFKLSVGRLKRRNWPSCRHALRQCIGRSPLRTLRKRDIHRPLFESFNLTWHDSPTVTQHARGQLYFF